MSEEPMEPNDWGLSPAITLDGALHCPRCGGDYMHHGAVTVHERDREDSAGIRTTVRGVHVETMAIPADLIPGRRNSLSIAFWCEGCPEGLGDRNLVIVQHKGQTIVSWEA